MNAVKRAFFLLLVVGLIVSAMLISRHWRRLPGNAQINFYGRIVDSSGTGVGNVEVTFEGGQNAELGFLPSAKATEKVWTQVVTTATNGDFELIGATGRYVRVAAVRSGGTPMGLEAINRKRDNDPAFGVSLDDLSRRALLPNTPQKRVLYRLVRLK